MLDTLPEQEEYGKTANLVTAQVPGEFREVAMKWKTTALNAARNARACC